MKSTDNSFLNNAKDPKRKSGEGNPEPGNRAGLSKPANTGSSGEAEELASRLAENKPEDARDDTGGKESGGADTGTGSKAEGARDDTGGKESGDGATDAVKDSSGSSNPKETRTSNTDTSKTDDTDNRARTTEVIDASFEKYPQLKRYKKVFKDDIRRRLNWLQKDKKTIPAEQMKEYLKSVYEARIQINPERELEYLANYYTDTYNNIAKDNIDIKIKTLKTFSAKDTIKHSQSYLSFYDEVCKKLHDYEPMLQYANKEELDFLNLLHDDMPMDRHNTEETQKFETSKTNALQQLNALLLKWKGITDPDIQPLFKVLNKPEAIERYIPFILTRMTNEELKQKAIDYAKQYNQIQGKDKDSVCKFVENLYKLLLHGDRMFCYETSLKTLINKAQAEKQQALEEVEKRNQRDSNFKTMIQQIDKAFIKYPELQNHRKDVDIKTNFSIDTTDKMIKVEEIEQCLNLIWEARAMNSVTESLQTLEAFYRYEKNQNEIDAEIKKLKEKAKFSAVNMIAMASKNWRQEKRLNEYKDVLAYANENELKFLETLYDANYKEEAIEVASKALTNLMKKMRETPN